MRRVTAAALAALIFSTQAESQVGAVPGPTYADLADLSLSAPVAAHVRVTRAARLKGADAVNVAPGKTRFYIEADVVSLIKGPGGFAPQISYLADLPHDATGKPAKLAKKSEFLLLGSTVPGRPGELRLSAPDAQIAWTPERGEKVRKILREAAGAEAPPKITGIGRAFHVPGAIPGESETQIFLQTADGRPVSLNILRRPGQQAQWAVALSEVVDEAARPPVPETLLWYRLACTLPQALPRQSFAEAEQGHVGAIQSDYRLVLDRLGPCARTRGRS